MAKKKIWEFPENLDPQPSMVFLVDESFTTQKLSLSGLTNSTFFSKFLTPISSGSYNGGTGCITFTTVSGANFNVCGFNAGGVSGFTYDNNNNLTISRNGLPSLTTNFSQVSGLTINGNLRVTGIISGGTLYGNATNLTGLVGSGTYDNSTKLITFFRNDGPAAYTVNLSTLDINDTYVTGGTSTGSSNSSPSATIGLRYNQDVPNGVYNLQYNDTFVTGFTYNDNNTFTIVSNNGNRVNATINTVTGLTVNGTLLVNGDVSGTTFYGDGTKLKGVINDASFDTNTNTITLVRNGGNISITGLTDGYVTGFTYSNNNIILTQNENLSPLIVNISVMTGLTINGNLNVNGNTTLSGTTNQIGNFNLTGVTAFNGNFTIQNANGTNTGINVFDTSLIPVGTTVVHQFQAEGGIIAHLGDLASGEPNSKGYFYMENNTVPTPCASRLVYYKISGVTSTVNGYLNLFTTGNTNNRLVYNYPPATGSSVTYLKYNISVSLSVNGGSRLVNIQLRRNGSPVPTTMTITSAGTGQPTSNNLTGIVSATNNDIFELYVNVPNNDTTDVTVSDLSVSLFT
jgi:hypothetical protein